MKTFMIISLAFTTLIGCGEAQNSQSNTKETSEAKQFTLEIVEATDQSFSLAFKYDPSKPELCTLDVNRVSITSPNAPSVGLTAGTIEIAADLIDNALCMPTVYVGAVDFKRGIQLPSIEDGRFALSINGIEYGIISVGSEGVALQTSK